MGCLLRTVSTDQPCGSGGSGGRDGGGDEAEHRVVGSNPRACVGGRGGEARPGAQRPSVSSARRAGCRPGKIRPRQRRGGGDLHPPRLHFLASHTDTAVYGLFVTAVGVDDQDGGGGGGREQGFVQCEPGRTGWRGQ